MMKKTTAPETAKAAEKAVPVNVLADPVVVKVEEPAKDHHPQDCCQEGGRPEEADRAHHHGRLRPP